MEATRKLPLNSTTRKSLKLNNILVAIIVNSSAPINTLSHTNLITQ